MGSSNFNFPLMYSDRASEFVSSTVPDNSYNNLHGWKVDLKARDSIGESQVGLREIFLKADFNFMLKCITLSLNTRK